MINTMLLYHGTAWNFSKIDLSRSRDRRDFGCGFYTTEHEKQAREWAHIIYLRNSDIAVGEFVNVYEFTSNGALRIKRFDDITIEWLDFIKLHRVEGGVHHDFDVVIGPVANDNTYLTISRYIDGTYTAEEAMNRLRYAKPNNQVSFHTEQALQCLSFVRSDTYGQ